MPVTSRLVFENQAILSRRSSGVTANLKDKPRRLSFHERRIELLQMSQQGALKVVGLADVDPLTGVRDSINARCGWSVRVDGYRIKGPRNELVKGHRITCFSYSSTTPQITHPRR